MDETKRLELIVEAVRYCQRVAAMGMPVAGYTKTLREAIYFAWMCRLGPKAKSAKYRSLAAVNLKWGRREICLQHAIPFKYQQAALLALSVVTVETVLPVLEKFDVCAIITADEDARLTMLGLQSEMPQGWNGGDPLARYKVAGIELVHNLELSMNSVGKDWAKWRSLYGELQIPRLP